MSEQPMPVSGREDVPEYAEKLFREMLARRVEKGIATYGTRLQTFNGRNAIRDAQEEAIDLWQYLCQIDLESRRDQSPAPLARQDDRLTQLLAAKLHKLMGCLAEEREKWFFHQLLIRCDRCAEIIPIERATLLVDGPKYGVTVHPAGASESLEMNVDEYRSVLCDACNRAMEGK